MRFLEVPAHLLPPLRNFRSWRAQLHGYSFVISLEMQTGPGFEDYTGYTASWKDMKYDMVPFGQQPSNRIDGGPWQTFTEAEQACKETLRALKSKQ